MEQSLYMGKERACMKSTSSIKQRFFLSSALNIILVILAIALVSNVLFKRAITDVTQKLQQRETALVSETIQVLIGNINDYLLTLSVDPTLQNVMKRYADAPVSGDERYNITTQLRQTVYAKTALNSYIESAALMAQSGSFFDVGNYSSQDLLQMLEQTGLNFDTVPNKPVWCGPIQMRNTLTGYEDVFVIAKQIVDIYSPDVLGLAFFIIKESSLSDFYSRMVYEDAKICVVDENDVVVSSADKDQLYRSLSDMGIVTQNSADYLFTSAPISTLGWRVLDFVPLHYLLSDMNRITMLIFVIGGVAVLLAFVISYTIASNVTRPLNQLANAMKTFDCMSGGLQMEVVAAPQEINLVTQRFNQLTDRVRELLMQITAENEKRRDYEFRLIQAQIKPHFLYNSLETIISLISIAKHSEAKQYTKSLGQFYRVSLSNGSDIITISEEIDLIRNYLYMQGIRYVDKMDYSVEGDSAALRYIMPKLTLQPIVENAIYHGIKPKKGRSRLDVRYRCGQDTVEVSIRDTGVGMPQALIDEVFGRKSCVDERKSFGLSSIDHRLRLVFGGDHRIAVESEQGQFTEVRITIPKREG